MIHYNFLPLRVPHEKGRFPSWFILKFQVLWLFNRFFVQFLRQPVCCFFLLIIIQVLYNICIYVHIFILPSIKINKIKSRETISLLPAMRGTFTNIGDIDVDVNVDVGVDVGS